MHCSHWDFLPSEIKLLIFSFDPTHFFNFKASLNSIPLSGTKSRLLQLLILYNNDLINPIRNHSYSSFPHLLSDFVNDHEYMLSILHTCKCCPRHQNRRPFSTINHLTNLNYNPQLRCGYYVESMPEICLVHSCFLTLYLLRDNFIIFIVLYE
jgi:hypothetical protein